MFSRRKLFQMLGLGSAAAVASRLPVSQLPRLMADTPLATGWALQGNEEVIDNYGMRMYVNWAQQQVNQHRSEMLHATNQRPDLM